MIFLVTGEVNEGKTNYMRSLYREIGEGDGFICPKVMEQNVLVRYDIQRLSSNETMPFACPIDVLPADWDEAYRFGKFSFSGRAIQFAEQIVTELIEQKIEPIIIDEIGPLEIDNHEGFYKTVNKVIDSGLGGFISVRRALINKFEETFGIDPRITRIKFDNKRSGS